MFNKTKDKISNGTHAAMHQDRQSIKMHMERSLPRCREYQTDHRGPICIFNQLHPLQVTCVGVDAECIHFLIGVPIMDRVINFCIINRMNENGIEKMRLLAEFSYLTA